MFKKLFRKNEVKRKDKITTSDISLPIPVHSTQQDMPTTANSEPVDIATPISVGVQAEYSPAHVRSSLLDDFGYTTVYDAIDTNRHSSKNKSAAMFKSEAEKSVNKNEGSISTLTSITSDDDEVHSDVIVTAPKKNTSPNNEADSPVYAQVRKEIKIDVSGKSATKSKGIMKHHISKKENNKMVKTQLNTSREKNHINLTRHISPKDEHADVFSFEDLPTIDNVDMESHSLPTHLPPAHSASPTSKIHKQKTNFSLLADNLPVYSLNQSLPLSSGDQAYLLTRTTPDGKVEHFTATVMSPTTSPVPYLLANEGGSLPLSPTKAQHPFVQMSSSVPAPAFVAVTSTPVQSVGDSNLDHQTLSMPQPDFFPSFNSEQMSPLHNQQQSVPVVNLVSGGQTAQKNEKQKRWSSPNDVLQVNQSTQTTSENNGGINLQDENVALKESLTQIKSELSLNSDEIDFTLDGVPLEQLIKDLPQRLRKALSSLNQTIAEKDINIQTYETELNNLKRKYDKLKQVNRKLTEISKEQQETILTDKQSFEDSLSEVKAENDELMQTIATQKSKHKQSKLEQKIKVTKLTSELHKLISERDSIKDELYRIQQCHIILQKLLKHKHSSVTGATVPLNKHKKTLKEFEHSHGHIQSNNSFKSENLILMAKIAKINVELLSVKKECNALKRDNKDYVERLARLQSELRDARARELTILSELTQAIKYSSNIPKSNYTYKLDH